MVKDNFLSGINFGVGIMTIVTFLTFASLGKVNLLLLIVASFNFYVSHSLKE